MHVQLSVYYWGCHMKICSVLKGNVKVSTLVTVDGERKMMLPKARDQKLSQPCSEHP